jgi:hypothetical protein
MPGRNLMTFGEMADMLLEALREDDPKASPPKAEPPKETPAAKPAGRRASPKGKKPTKAVGRTKASS